MSFYIDATTRNKRKYIILTQNKINQSSEGAKIYINTNVLDENRRNEATMLFTSLTNNNIIILNFAYQSSQDITTSNCLLTLNNIKNNIKFLFTDNNKFGKLVFIKNTNIQNYDISKNYLLLKNFIDSDSNKDKYHSFHLNYYFNNIDTSSNFHNNTSLNNANYDYYKLNIKDYIFRDFSTSFFSPGTSSDICYNGLMCKIKSIPDEYTNLYRDSSLSNFTRFSDISNITSLTQITSTNNTTPFSIYNNIYNKYTINNKKIVYEVDLSKADVSLTISFETFLIRTNNFEIVRKATSQILFDTSSNIHFLNVQVSTPSKPIIFPTKTINPYIIYLSLGNFRTGLIQSDIYKHVSFPYNSGKITFVENINTSSIFNPLNVKKKYDSLQLNIDTQFLYDIELSANILTKSVSAYNIFTSINKIFTVNFSNFFDLSNLRNYYNSFNNFAFTTVSNTIIRPNVNYFASASNYNINSISFDIVSVTSNNLYTRNSTAQTLLNSYYNLTKPALLDVRFNYDSYFYTNFTFNVLYNYSANYEIINTYSINFGSLIYTTPGRDFTDVECIYIYHNPETDPNPLYRYPNNNIEIIRDPSNIDTISKAIELLPGASTSTSNSIIIPEKNGSNLSRKMIQGLIGLNNVPKLLSIKPYDESSIAGRGFINQYQIEEECITTTEDIIKNKINANKHSSAKDSRTFTTNKLEKQNFANLVRSNRRNRLSQQCIENLREDIRNGDSLSTQVNYSTIPRYTPRFKIFKTGQGHYL